MDFKLIFTANAGFLLFFENFTVSVDAFHNERAFPFSTLPQGLIRQMAQEGFFLCMGFRSPWTTGEF